MIMAIGKNGYILDGDNSIIMPVTNAQNVIVDDDGTRLNAKMLKFDTRVGDPEQVAGINAESLGGHPASYYNPDQHIWKRAANGLCSQLTGFSIASIDPNWREMKLCVDIALSANMAHMVEIPVSKDELQYFSSMNGKTTFRAINGWATSQYAWYDITATGTITQISVANNGSDIMASCYGIIYYR